MDILAIGDFRNLPLAISLLVLFGSGFLGSFHCGFMCGPLCMSFIKTKNDFYEYQFFRLLGYLSIAIALYSLQSLFGLQEYQFGGSSLMALLFYLFLIFWALLRFPFFAKLYLRIHQNLQFVSLYQKLANAIFKRKLFRPLFFGYLNAFIPCGWLWLFLITSMQAPNILWLSLWTICFWLSSVPILYFARFKAKNIAIPHKKYLIYAIAIALIAFSILNLSKVLRDGLFQSKPQTNGILCH